VLGITSERVVPPRVDFRALPISTGRLILSGEWEDIVRRLFVGPIVAAVAWLSLSFPALAQDHPIQKYPTRGIRVIIPLGPGGGGDVFTRAFADELQKAWGQPVVVENRTGGALNIGARACAEATPDGYTICVLSSEPVVYNQLLYKSLPFDPEKDFEPIANLFFNTLALVANSGLKLKTIPDLIAMSKARPGTLSYGTFSFPLAHFMEKLKKETGADIVRVPFRSGGEVVNAVLSGTTPVALLALSNMVTQLQSGYITGLAVSAKSRAPLFPDIPTLAETRGGEDYPSTWFGLFAPAGTPKPIVDKIAGEVTRIVNEPAFRQRMFFDRAVEPGGTRQEEFARFIREERKVAERIVQESGLAPQ
jgi:tripartite-type tricarboxylate transporter receptor subunit TctC